MEIHQGDHVNALEHITKAKALVYDELWTRTGYHDFSASNYTSAMKTLAKAEMLCEMEEVIRCEKNPKVSSWKVTLITSIDLRQTRSLAINQRYGRSIGMRGCLGKGHGDHLWKES